MRVTPVWTLLKLFVNWLCNVYTTGCDFQCSPKTSTAQHGNAVCNAINAGNAVSIGTLPVQPRLQIRVYLPDINYLETITFRWWQYRSAYLGRSTETPGQAAVIRFVRLKTNIGVHVTGIEIWL